MKDALYMAWQYLFHHKVKTMLLVFAIALIVYLPVGLKVIVDQTAQALTERARVTPLVIGAKGSSLELVLNSLYFESAPPLAISYSEVDRVASYNGTTAIPVYSRFKVRHQPIIGTTIDYFRFRRLKIAAGRQMAMLGECVVGAAAARRLGVSVGDAVISSPDSVFDLAGVYPLKMNVVGVLKSTDSPDDEAVFADVKTTWTIAGLAHGHEKLSDTTDNSKVIGKGDGVIVANAAVIKYNEITPENVNSFHFHGDMAEFPVTAVIAIPKDDKSSAILQGKYLGEDELVQIVRPFDVMNDLTETVVSIRQYVLTAVIVIGISTVITTILVFMLSLRLRKREVITMHRIGGSRARVFSILSAEIVVTIFMGVCLAGILTVITAEFGTELIRSIVMQ